MKRSLGSALLVASLAACGGHEDPPPTIAPVVEAPTPVPTPTPSVTPTNEPTATNENEEALLEELEHEAAQFTMMHVTVNYDRVAYAEPVQHALEQQVRAVVTSHRDFFDNFSPTIGDSGNDPDALDMRCDVTLATNELVAYAVSRSGSPPRMHGRWSAKPCGRSSSMIS
jgi:hypothetical protein